jgi:predicted ester cyclase
MRFLAAFCLFATIPVHAASPGDDGARNVALIREYAELGRRGEYEKQATYWSSDAVNNGRPMQPAMIRTILEDIYRTFPDYRSEVVETIAKGDLVVTLSRVTGTHRGIAQTNFNGGMLKGARPTGLRFEVLQTHWWRIRDGKIVWHQGVRDDLGMLRQLGLVATELPPDKRAPPS